MNVPLTPETRIVLGRDAGPTARRAAAYLTTSIETRTGWAWPTMTSTRPRTGDLVISAPDDGGIDRPPFTTAEEIAVFLAAAPDGDGDAPRTMHDAGVTPAGADGPTGQSAPMVVIQAGSDARTLAAAGLFLRNAVLDAGRVEWPQGTIRRQPAYPIRGHTLACHRQNNTADKWELADWEEYLTELSAWGDNTVVVYPLHPARWPHALPFNDPPWFDSEARAQEFDRQWRIHRRLPELTHELGLRYGIWLPVNDVFPEQVARDPGLTRHGGPYVCPARPAARAAIREIRARLFAELPALDVLFLPSKDDGGCPGCPDCTPWTPTYIELVTEQAEQARAHHPDCAVWLSAQGLHPTEAQTLFGWLDRDRPQWVEALAAGPFGETITFGDQPKLGLTDYPRSGQITAPIARARAALPGDYRLVLYPDETHTFRCQYPITRMDPAVRRVWGREDGPAPRPIEMAELHAATSPFSDGATPYSEGDTDDLNKFVWSALNVDPTRMATDIVREYCRWFFGPSVEERATRICLDLEELLGGPIVDDPLVAETVNSVRSCEEDQPALRHNWRWLLLRLAALMLAHIATVQRRDRAFAATLRYRLASFDQQLDPRSDLDAALDDMRRRMASTDDLLADIVATRDLLFALHKVAVRGVARLQNSYQRWDLVEQDWRAIRRTLDDSTTLADYPRWRDALNVSLQRAETAHLDGMAGVPIIAPLSEAPWESGQPDMAGRTPRASAGADG